MARIINVYCPVCKTTRQMPKTSWKKPKDGEGPPYIKRCKSCSNKNKGVLSDESRKKISDSLKGVKKSEDMKSKLSQFRQENPESYKRNLRQGVTSGWNKGMMTGPRSEETKKKISDSMKNRKNDTNNES